MALGPLLQYSLSALSPLLVARLQMSATDFGMLWFVTFGVASAFTISGGKLVDRFGPRPLLILVCCAAGLALVIAGSAMSYLFLVVASCLSGLAQSAANPATNLLIVAAVPEGRQGLVLGIKQSGVQIGQFAVGLLLPALALLLGWRTALLSCSAIAAVSLAAILWTVPTLRPQKAGQPEPAARASRMQPDVWWMTAYSFLTGAVLMATNVYLPLYAHDTLGASLKKTGLIVAALGGLGVVSRLAWGRAVERVVDVRTPLLWLSGLGCAAMAAFTLVQAVGEALLWLGIVVFAFSITASNVIIMMGIMRTVDRQSIGSASGWASLGLYAGFMVGPLAFGAVVDMSGFIVAWMGTTTVMVALTAVTGTWRRRVLP